MSTNRLKRCQYVNPQTNLQCEAFALTAKSHCRMHDAASKESCREAARKGGKNRKSTGALPKDTPPLELTSACDVARAVASIINDVRVGRMDCKVGNSLGVLCSVLLKALDNGELERRLEAHEARQAANRMKVA